MMHHSPTNLCRSGIRSQSLLLLCSWLSIPLGVGASSFNNRAQATDLESPVIPEAAPAAPTVAPAAPVDTFIDPPEPAWEPAPAPVVPVAPEPIAQPEAPPAPTAQSAPVVSPQIMPQVAESTETSQPTDKTYIEPESHNLGETATKTPTEKTVLTGSVSGCKASLDIDPVLAATLCGPRVVQTAQQPAPNPSPQYSPAPPLSSYSYAEPAPRQTAYAPSASSSASYSSAAPTPWVSGAPASSNPLTAASPSQKFLAASPNPLKWLVPNQQRMIFPLPVPASITSAFGWRTHPISGASSFHAGTDLAAPLGTPVLATFPGQVETAGYMGGYGLAVLLQHQQGQIATRYAHLSKVYVQPGQWVSQGTIIGLVGSTGNSTGPHLHYETLKKQKNNSLVAIDSGIQIKGSLAELIRAMQTAKVPPQPQS